MLQDRQSYLITFLLLLLVKPDSYNPQQIWVAARATVQEIVS